MSLREDIAAYREYGVSPVKVYLPWPVPRSVIRALRRFSSQHWKFYRLGRNGMVDHDA